MLVVSLLGCPYDHGSTFLRGAAGGPAAIRSALSSAASNWCAESGVDLDGHAGWCDAGDLELGDQPLTTIEVEAHARLERGRKVLALGGDHAVTLPLLRAHARSSGPLHVMHFDAHPDLYDAYEGDRYTHASPFARAAEEGLLARLVQIGIRSQNPHQAEQARRFGVEQVTAGAVGEFDPESLGSTPLYLSIDLDVLDPAFAPGVSHHEPGGLTVRELISIVQRLRAPVIGADLVELNPRRDPSGITAAAAAKLVKELLAKMLTR